MIIRVVSALVLDGADRMLMALRPLGVRRPNSWENPGGKVEPGEVDADALQREVREELGVESKIGEVVSVARLDLEETLILTLYRVWISGTPQPLASQKLRWMDPHSAVIAETCSPATYLFYRDIMQHIEKTAER